MRTALLYMVIVIVLLIASGCGDGSNSEVMRNMVAAVAEHAELLFENDYVAVIKFELDPGDEIPAHECTEHIIYALNSFSIDMIKDDAHTTEEFRRGNAYWREACTEAAVNSGQTPAEYLVVMRKSSELPELDTLGIQEDLATIAPDNTVMLLSNDKVRVVEAILNPGDRLPGHSGVNRLVYSLNSYEVTYRESQMERNDVSFQEGDIDWFDAGAYSIVNIGTNPAHFVVFEFEE